MTDDACVIGDYLPVPAEIIIYQHFPIAFGIHMETKQRNPLSIKLNVRQVATIESVIKTPVHAVTKSTGAIRYVDCAPLMPIEQMDCSISRLP